MQIYDRWSDTKFLKLWNEVLYWDWKNYEDFWEKWGPENNAEDYAKWVFIIAYSEGLGVPVKRRLIEVSLIHDLMSGVS